jgi:hypothetical protein
VARPLLEGRQGLVLAADLDDQCHVAARRHLLDEEERQLGGDGFELISSTGSSTTAATGTVASTSKDS